MAPKNIKDVITMLKKHGFKNFKLISKTRICVLVPWNEREKTMQYLINNIDDWTHTRRRGATLGAISRDGFVVEVKPIEAQGSNSPGVENELILKSMIEQYIAKYNKINITFKSDKKTITYSGIAEVSHIGRAGSKNIKSDLILSNKKESFGISIKKDNSEFWAKIENYYGERAMEILNQCLKDKIVNLKDQGDYFRISSELAFKPDTKAKKDIVFGSDNATVIKRTFSFNDFKFDRRSKTLIVNTSFIAATVRDLKNENDVYCIIRNDAARNSKKLGIRGLTIEGVTRKRIEGNKNLIYLADSFF